MTGKVIESFLDNLSPVSVEGRLPEKVYGISQDSRLIEPGYIFAARSGARSNGADFISQAAERGAVLVIASKLPTMPSPLPLILVPNFHKALETLSRLIYRDPSARLKLIGVTGTNGKTTTVHMIRSILAEAGQKCGLLSTIGYDTLKRKIDASLTTPDIDRTGALLCEMADEGCGWAVMEVSSHALSQGRMNGLKLAAAGFTNLSRDHLDYHGNFDSYAEAKARLFRSVSPDGFSMINIGDSHGPHMAEAAAGRVTTYRADGGEADLRVSLLDHSLQGGRFQLESAGREFSVHTPLIGVYQGENIGLAAGVALGFGVDIECIKAGIERLSSVPGRMEGIDQGQPFAVLVDYSHTPDALESALKSLRPLCRNNLIVVFGCGGDRDRSKRPEMGRVVAELADRIIVTNDNPRTEDPAGIADEIIKGVKLQDRKRTMILLDRRSAIKHAISIATEGDVVLIAGKGHENYQLIGGVRRQFDDREVAAEELNRIGWVLSGRPSIS